MVERNHVARGESVKVPRAVRDLMQLDLTEKALDAAHAVNLILPVTCLDKATIATLGVTEAAVEFEDKLATALTPSLSAVYSEGYQAGLEAAAKLVGAVGTANDSDFTRGIVEGRNWSAAAIRAKANKGE